MLIVKQNMGLVHRLDPKLDGVFVVFDPWDCTFLGDGEDGWYEDLQQARVMMAKQTPMAARLSDQAGYFRDRWVALRVEEVQSPLEAIVSVGASFKVLPSKREGKCRFTAQCLGTKDTRTVPIRELDSHLEKLLKLYRGISGLECNAVKPPQPTHRVRFLEEELRQVKQERDEARGDAERLDAECEDLKVRLEQAQEQRKEVHDGGKALTNMYFHGVREARAHICQGLKSLAEGLELASPESAPTVRALLHLAARYSGDAAFPRTKGEGKNG